MILLPRFAAQVSVLNRFFSELSLSRQLYTP
jgi:hypothetical protein